MSCCVRRSVFNLKRLKSVEVAVCRLSESEEQVVGLGVQGQLIYMCTGVGVG